MEEPTRKPAILAGDQEREHSTELLSQAVVEGRLTLEEFSDRVGRAQAARTREELALLTEDLPTPPTAPAPTMSTEAVPTQHRHVAAFSRLVRSGPWELAERSEFRCIFGTITLDLSQARLAGSAVALEIFNLFGTVTVLVPEGVDVSVTGGHELVVVAASVAGRFALACDCDSVWKSLLAVARHTAIACAESPFDPVPPIVAA